MEDFQKDVLTGSYEIPVVVDFWAPWCGPCKMLGPVIEELATLQKDTWKLVKINVEDHPEIASTYQIRSIPHVKMFYRGEMINEFTGALPRQMIIEWLNKVLPAPGRIELDLLMAKPDPPTDDDLHLLWDRYPDDPEIRLALSQALLWKDPEKAFSLLEPIRMGTLYFDHAEFIRAIAKFLLHKTADETVSHIQSQLSDADLENAIPAIISVLGKDKDACDGLLSKATIGIFNLLGTQHPITRMYRKQFDMVLWV